MQQWEYKIIRLSDPGSIEFGKEYREHGESRLNKYGQQGWEVAGMVFADDANYGFTVILKRPLAT